jgi:hypothetical protein
MGAGVGHAPAASGDLSLSRPATPFGNMLFMHDPDDTQAQAHHVALTGDPPVLESFWP